MLIARLLKQLLSSNRGPANVTEGPLGHAANRSMTDYSFSTDWFSCHIPVWKLLIGETHSIGKILEIGSYEGRSTTWLIENAFRTSGKGEIFCIDPWTGGIEHQATDMSGLEERFKRNIEIAKSRTSAEITVTPLKGLSIDHLIALIANGHRLSFDLIYIDGSHECPDVLNDLVLSFQLCKVGGLIICDDYLWSRETHGSEDLLHQPKLAIDSFVNCYRRKLFLYNTILSQIYIKKTSI